MKTFKNAIVITGGIGTGKSTVSQLIKAKGYKVIDADEISHQILDDSYGEISSLFGSEFVKDDKVLRKKLGNLVFHDKEKLTKLESLLHPKVKDEILKQALNLEKENKYYFIDIPLFFETKNYMEFNKVLVVYAPKELALERIMRRNKLTKEEALVRLNSQINIEEKKKLATFLIQNIGSKDELEEKVVEFLEDIL